MVQCRLRSWLLAREIHSGGRSVLGGDTFSPWASAGDVRSTVGLFGPYDFLPFDIDVTKKAFGNARGPAQTQPISFARRNVSPVFLPTGSQDTTALPRNSERLALALGKAGAQSVSLKI